MSGRVHLLVPGSREQVKCGASWSTRAGTIVTSREFSAVTCHNCLGSRRGYPAPPPSLLGLVRREYPR
jgi:hypothetical protein